MLKVEKGKVLGILYFVNSVYLKPECLFYSAKAIALSCMQKVLGTIDCSKFMSGDIERLQKEAELLKNKIF